VAAVGLEGIVHQLALALDNGGVVGAVKEPYGQASDGVGVVGGEGGNLSPAVRRVAPEDAGGGDGHGRPAVGVGAGQLPGAVAAQ